MAETMRLEASEEPSAKLRRLRAESLAEYMATQGMTRKELRRHLQERGVHVTLQAIGTWLRGEYTPRAHIQAHVAAVLSAPAHRVFPTEIPS